jgi:hypothetical protein
MNIHKIYNFDELKLILNYFKENNYAYISYIAGEYGIINSIYNIVCYDFYLKMKNKGIKTVAFVLKDMKSFAYGCCDEIIEYQDIEFNDNTANTDLFNNENYYGCDGCASNYTRGIRSKCYEAILKECNFSNLFFTLNCDGGFYYNNSTTFDETYETKTEFDYICLYKIDNINIYLESLKHNSFINLYKYKKSDIIRDFNIKTRNIAIWIRNTNKHTYRNTLKSTYETVFDYCIQNKIYCNVFLDLIPTELPNNEYIINRTERYKNRPNWDNILEIVNDCDFYIGSNSGSTEFILSNSKVNLLYDQDLNYPYFKYLYTIINKKKEEGFICELINFPKDFANILNMYYN